MHLFLTGGTGFIGAHVLRALVAEGHTARCLVRRTDDVLPVQGAGIERVRGDVTDPRSLTGLLRGCDGVIHLVGIIEERPSAGVTFASVHVEGTRHVIEAARDAEIERFVHMSANGARAQAPSAYGTTKWRAEALVREAGFRHWTIFRPSLVFGDPGPERIEFATRLARTLVKPFPILPVFGDGGYKMRPVAVEELATAIVRAVTHPKAHGQAYCAAGPDVLRYNDVLDVIAEGLGLAPKPKIHQPVWLARPLVQAAGRFGLLPITPDQFEMLLEGNTCDPTAFRRDFDLGPPTPFTAETLAYLRKRVAE